MKMNVDYVYYIGMVFVFLSVVIPSVEYKGFLSVQIDDMIMTGIVLFLFIIGLLVMYCGMCIELNEYKGDL